jgi:hypothetical protein
MSDTQSFENFIIKCCEMDEWDLRSWLREKLTEADFKIQEDKYKSYRPGKYQEVHNMLAIRGNKPRVCLVAHTDVCRDHGSMKFMHNHKKAIPVIKELNRFGKIRRVIQDEHCKVQVGGDDRLGVAINTWIALNTGYDMGLLYTTDEEVGNLAAEFARFSELRDFDICCQVDRGNHSGQLVTSIGRTRLCSPETAERLLNISKDIGFPRVPVNGMMTDVLALTENGMCKEAVNMTCGYHRSFGSGPEEYIDITEAVETKIFVATIIQDYELETISDIEEKNRLEKEYKKIEDIATDLLDKMDKPMTQEEMDDMIWN